MRVDQGTFKILTFYLEIKITTLKSPIVLVQQILFLSISYLSLTIHCYDQLTIKTNWLLGLTHY